MWNAIDLLSGFPQLRPNSIVEPNFYAVERKPKQEQNLLRLLVNNLVGVFSSLRLLPLTEFSREILTSPSPQHAPPTFSFKSGKRTRL